VVSIDPFGQSSDYRLVPSDRPSGRRVSLSDEFGEAPDRNAGLFLLQRLGRARPRVELGLRRAVRAVVGPVVPPLEEGAWPSPRGREPSSPPLREQGRRRGGEEPKVGRGASQCPEAKQLLAQLRAYDCHCGRRRQTEPASRTAAW
jgi:hypothetical protein